jgi:uncharacterized coiled-coil protein SlyX
VLFPDRQRVGESLLLTDAPGPESGFLPFRKISANLARQILENNDERKKHVKTTTNIIYPAFAAIALGCFAFSPTAPAQLSPPPDGGYPNANTAEGDDALFSLTTGSNNTGSGFEALLSNTIGFNNTATGFAALGHNTTGFNNTADGVDALFGNTTGHNNTADGQFALISNITGSSNTANGFEALAGNTTGSNNIALGLLAGFNLTTGDNNIDIGNQGVAAEANTIRIGNVGSQTATYIAGITSRTSPRGVPVFINANGQLGTVTSSARFKDEIRPMDKTSEAILALKPVTFHYKKELDPERIPQFGLVAEEVEKVNPDLVVRDDQGKVYTVRYDAVNAMLLNEFLKEHRRVQEQQATIAQLQKSMETLVARLKDQASQIQKVSAELELSKPPPQMVGNNQ